MPRSIWSGAINFGMVSIPVKLYPATESKSISFHLLHDKDNARIKELKWCPVDDHAVSWDELVRGYEYAKGQYIKMTAEDFEKLPLPSKQAIEVSSFTRSTDIDPLYHEKSYCVEPDEAAIKPFVLFMKALSDKNVVGLATVTLRNKERLCALRPSGGVLILDTLLYPDEIRISTDRQLPKARLTKAEMDMAYNLVELMVKPFNPQDYHDHYREALQQLIESKLEGQELVAAPQPGAPGKVINLLEALQGSLQKAKGKKSAGSVKKTARKAGKTTTAGKSYAKTKEKPARHHRRLAG